jgi:hypothetical protein
MPEGKYGYLFEMLLYFENLNRDNRGKRLKRRDKNVPKIVEMQAYMLKIKQFCDLGQKCHCLGLLNPVSFYFSK